MNIENLPSPIICLLSGVYNPTLKHANIVFLPEHPISLGSGDWIPSLAKISDNSLIGSSGSQNWCKSLSDICVIIKSRTNNAARLSPELSTNAAVIDFSTLDKVSFSTGNSYV